MDFINGEKMRTVLIAIKDNKQQQHEERLPEKKIKEKTSVN